MPNRLHQPASVRILYLGALPLVLLLSACSSNNGGGTPAPLAAPTITVQPQNETVTTPATATFSVTATGNPAPTYQWYMGGVSLGSDAVSASYTTPATTTAMSGNSYTVVVTNSQGTVTSTPAVLTANAPVLVAPTISVQPASQTVDAGSTATFTVTATGNPAPTYQWYLGTVSLGATATSASYTTPAATTAMSGNSYTVVVTNSQGSVTSDAAVLTVNTGTLSAPVITQQPTSQTVTVGDPATFTVVATGYPAPTYQWNLHNGGVVGTAATYTTPATTGAMNGNSYTVTVTNSQGSVTSSPEVELWVAMTADQTVYYDFVSSPNEACTLWWDLPVSGTPVNGTNYLDYNWHNLGGQPLYQGPQESDNSALAVMSSLEVIPGIPVPSRFLVNNAIVVGSDPDWKRLVSMPGPVIQVDLYAVDGKTIVETTMISQNSVVSLTGPIVTVNASTAASAYPDLTNWYDEIFFNPSLLKGTTSWAANSAYRKYVQTIKGDTYFVFDYSTTQSDSGTTPQPVASGTTVAQYMTANPQGVHSSTDNTYYTLANMTATTVGTVPTWVANAVRPNRTTPVYFTLYEINGNVYCGEVIKDGTVLGGNSYHVGTPSSYTINYSVGYYISLNAYALQSLEGALNF